MSKLTRRAYWRLVRERAWTLSKEHFQLAYPFAVYALVVAFAWWKWGKQRAIDDFLTPDSLGLIALAVIAVAMYGVNLFRAAADIHEEQLSGGAKLQEASRDKVAALEKRLRELEDVPDPLRISFEPGVLPYEQRHSVIVGVRLGGMREGVEHPVQSTKTLFVVRVENHSNRDIQNVSVRLNFEPAQRDMSDLPLRLMGDDGPIEGQHPRTFTLPAFGYQYVKVVLHSTPNPRAEIIHCMRGVGDAIPEGQYLVVITAYGNGVRPHEARFTIDVQPEGLHFQPAAGDAG